jgi:hypothetical protein
MGSSAPATSATPALLVALPGQPTWLGEQRVLFRASDGSRSVMVDAHALSALQVMDRFRTRDGHAAILAQAGGIPVARATQMVDALVAAGLLVGPDHFLAGTAVPASPAPDPLVVIRAHRQPQGVQRLLRSALADEQRHGTRRRYLIVDDTDDAAHARELAGLASAFARDSASTVYQLDVHVRHAALAVFEDLVPAADRTRWLELFDPGHPTSRMGARGWNWGVLASAGSALSFADQDTVFPLRLPPDVESVFDPVNGIAADTTYYDDDGYLGLAPLDEDPFAWLGRFVGRSPAELFARDGWRRDRLVDENAGAIAHLRPGARVLAAFTGVYGGLAFNSSAWLNVAPAASMASLWRQPYRHERLEADAVWHGARAPRLLDHAVYAPLLIDARELLPFAGTWALADDTYFLALLSGMVSRPLYAFVPAMLGHLPFEPRHRLRNSLQPLLLDPNALAAMCFDQFGRGLAGEDRAVRLRAIGAQCADLARADDAMLNARILALKTTRRANLVAALTDALARAPLAPPQWREHAQRVLTVNGSTLAESRLADDEIALWRRLLDQAAFGCAIWPALWQRAIERPLIGTILRPA